MGGAVSPERQRLWTFGGHDANGGITREGMVQIDEPVSHASRQGRLGQPWRDRGRDVADGRARRHTAAGSVGQYYGDLAHAERTYRPPSQRRWAALRLTSWG